MKFKLPIWLCVVISLVLVAFGLCYGTVTGYADERAHVTDLIAGESGLGAVLSYRGADGLNLCVVAERHLSGDADVAALQAAAKAAQSESGALDARKAADAALQSAFAKVAGKLAADPGFQQSERDKRYLDMLQTDFDNLARSGIIKTYNEAVQTFNQKLNKPVSGFIATLVGVKPCETY
ncbi:MAG: hypothetical protein PHY12_02405 [Eubacteriales bacterium]|nr:hypothetical protein [Eubacteriales bacterium]